MEIQNLNEISYAIIGYAYKVHRQLGPGLLESTYEVCLEYELKKAGLQVQRQVYLPIIYESIKLDAGYKIDLLIENQIIVELKAIDKIAPVHQAQLMAYLKLSGKQLGLLINFNVPDLQQGIKRIIM
jgi:GxxExxY protein